MDQKLIKDLRSILDSGQLEPYLKYVFFPTYKNLEPFTQIDFTFPITVLVGSNGSNKSSILKALNATTDGVSLGDLWFSTKIDPIDYTKENAPCFVYGYQHIATNIEAQVLYIKYYRKDDPDYWEPGQPRKKYGMRGMPTDPTILALLKNKSRWEKYNKKSLYLTFRDSISAFDKYFYYGDIAYNGTKISTRKKTIRRNSSPLKKAIESQSLSYSYDKKERIVNKENFELTVAEVQTVSTILDIPYQAISWIKHTFFKCIGYTCKIKREDIDYSEAFAGSGEFAVIRMVTQINRTQDNSLILLDEPEVSLHPGAQTRLIQFLAEAVKQKKHQIVIASHSPAIVRELPPDAIKVFTTNPVTKKVELLKQEYNPHEAFYFIGETTPGKKNIIVEDVLAHMILLKAIENESDAFKDQFNIQFYPGGSSVIWNQYAVTYALANNKDIFIVFDADQKTTATLKPSQDIPESQNTNLDNLIKSYCLTSIIIPTNAKDTPEHIANKRKFIDWTLSQVKFLPGNGNPEKFIWGNMQPTTSLSHLDSEPNFKTRFYKLTEMKLGTSIPIDGKAILYTQREMLNTIPNSNPALLEILELLKSIAAS